MRPLLLLAALWFGGCACQPVEQQAVILRGAVVTSRSQPLAGVGLELERVNGCNLSEQLLGSTHLTTDAVGAYAHPLTAEDLALTSFGTLKCLRLKYERDGGAQATAVLRLALGFDAGPGVTTLEGPKLVEWVDPPMLSNPSAQRVVFDESTLPEDADGTPRAFVWLSTADGGFIFGSGEVPAASMSFSELVLEDFPQPRVQAVAMRRWRALPLIADLAFTSAPSSVTGGALVPMSRGAACSWPDGGVCPFTDGALTRHEPRRLRELVITLSRRATLRRALVRGLFFFPVPEGILTGDFLIVEGDDADGGWQPLGSVPAVSGDTSLALSGQPAQLVRVRLATGGGVVEELSSLSEVSLFE